METYTILVSGASGIVGYGILKSIKKYGYRLIGTTVYDISPANCFADIVEIAPLSTSEAYIPWLIHIVEKYHVDMLIPGIEIDMSVWNLHRKRLSETGAVLLINNGDLIRLCLDKWNFYKKMKESGSPYRIDTFDKPDFNRFPIPFILKPRCGFGSKGMVKVENEKVFETYKSEIGKKLIMQEYVGSMEEEYTAAAFFDRDSDLKAHIVMRRKLSGQGYTEYAQVVFIQEMEAVIRQLAKLFKPVGPTNFQFRKHKENWRLLEINPRISSSTSIRAAFGYEEAKMCIDYFLGQKEVSQPRIRSGRAIRYTEDFVIYDSDHI